MATPKNKSISDIKIPTRPKTLWKLEKDINEGPVMFADDSKALIKAALYFVHLAEEEECPEKVALCRRLLEEVWDAVYLGKDFPLGVHKYYPPNTSGDHI